MSAETIWKAGDPDQGKGNLLLAEQRTGELLITLKVIKPGCNWERSITLQATKEQLLAATEFVDAKWVQLFEHDDKNGTYVATRILPIPGTAFLLVWRIKHVDKHKDGSEYLVDDDVQVLPIYQHGALGILAIKGSE